MTTLTHPHKTAVATCLYATLALLLAHADAATQATPSEPTTPAPHLFVEQPEYDLGLVPYLHSFTHVFALTNTGNAPLELNVSKKDCKCSIAALSHSVLLPGQKGTLEVGYIPGEHASHGAIEYTIRLFCNDPERNTPVLKLKARAVKPVEVVPAKVALEPDPENGNCTGTFVVEQYSFDSPAPTITVEPSSPALIIDALEKSTIPSGIRTRYRVHISSAPTDALHEHLTVQTDSQIIPQIEIPVEYAPKTTAAINLNPPILTLGVLSKNKQALKETLLHLAPPCTFTVTAATCTDPRIQVELLPGKEDAIALRLTITPDNTAGTIKTLIHLTLNNGGKLDLPVLGVLAD